MLESRQTSGSRPPGMKRNGEKKKYISMIFPRQTSSASVRVYVWTDILRGASAWHVLQCRNLNFKCGIVIDEEYS